MNRTLQERLRELEIPLSREAADALDAAIARAEKAEAERDRLLAVLGAPYREGNRHMNLDLEDDTFQAYCQIDHLSHCLQEGGRIQHVRDDVVTMLLADGSETTINLAPIQHLLDGLRKLT